MTTPPKPLLTSRTAIFALLTALLGLCGWESETVSAFLQENTELILLVVGLINLVLRRVTHERVALVPDPPDPPHPDLY